MPITNVKLKWRENPTNSSKVSHPRHEHEGDGDDVVDKHLGEVLPFHVKEEGGGEGDVEGKLARVVPPGCRVDGVKRVARPAECRVPHPRPWRQKREAVEEEQCVEKAAKGSLQVEIKVTVFFVIIS